MSEVKNLTEQAKRYGSLTVTLNVDDVTALLQRAEAAEATVSDVNEVIALLSEREWAEHCTKTETGKKLEELITELHDDVAPPINLAQLVPPETSCIGWVRDEIKEHDKKWLEMLRNIEEQSQ